MVINFGIYVSQFPQSAFAFNVGAALILQAPLYCTMTISTIISGAAGID